MQYASIKCFTITYKYALQSIKQYLNRFIIHLNTRIHLSLLEEYYYISMIIYGQKCTLNLKTFEKYYSL